MCAAPILEMQDVHVRFGGVHAIAGLSFTVTRGEILSIIGPNGAGKTSVFNCISGHRRPIAGGIAFEGHDITAVPARRRAGMGIGRTFQNLALFGQMSVLENPSVSSSIYCTRCGTSHDASSQTVCVAMASLSERSCPMATQPDWGDHRTRTPYFDSMHSPSFIAARGNRRYGTTKLASSYTLLTR